MSEIEITLPTVQYGNVKVRATPEELGLHVAHPGQMGSAVAVYLNLFSQGFKEGAAMDVVYTPEDLPDRRLAAKQYADSKVNAESVIGSDAPGDVQAAAMELLDEGLGGVTEIEATSVVEASGIAPWDDSDLKVDAKPKPWETEVATW